MKLLIIAVSILLCGCSTIRTVGDLEPLNDVGLSNVRETARVIDQTMNVLGQPRTSQLNTSRINTGYGNAKNIQTNDVATVVAEVQDLLRYFNVR